MVLYLRNVFANKVFPKEKSTCYDKSSMVILDTFKDFHCFLLKLCRSELAHSTQAEAALRLNKAG